MELGGGGARVAFARGAAAVGLARVAGARAGRGGRGRYVRGSRRPPLPVRPAGSHSLQGPLWPPVPFVVGACGPRGGLREREAGRGGCAARPDEAREAAAAGPSPEGRGWPDRGLRAGRVNSL